MISSITLIVGSFKHFVFEFEVYDLISKPKFINEDEYLEICFILRVEHIYLRR